VLDEPTAGMDPAAKAATRELIVSLRDAGVTILVTTHELIDVERLADRIAIIDHGRIVAEGTPAELAAGAEPSLRVRLDRPLGPADRASLETALRASKPGPAPVGLLDDGGPGRYRLSGSGPDPAVVAAVAAWCASAGVLIVELRTAGATLEERYLELTARSAGDAA